MTFLPSRRFLLKLFLGSPLLLNFRPTKGNPIDHSPQDYNENRYHYFDKNSRLSISMWDFSWLKASHSGGAYENLEKRVLEAQQRGYNTLRIDCFPSHILQGTVTFNKNYNPTTDLPRWGQTAVTHKCNVLERLTQLAEYCRKYNLWLGLDAWDKAHIVGHDRIIEPDEEEQTFRKIADTWVKALKLMRDAGVLERAVWVAPMNEVPHYCAGKLRSIINLRKKIDKNPQAKPEVEQTINKVYKRVNHWMGAPIKEEIEKDNIPLSYSSVGLEHYNKRVTDVYDVIDVHFLPLVIMDTDDKQAFEEIEQGASKFIGFNTLQQYDLAKYSQVWNAVCKKNYAQMLTRVREHHQKVLDRLILPSGKRLTPVITESFGPCVWPDHPEVSWEWYQRYNADAMRIVAHLPFAGSSISNYAEPIFSLWESENWHYTANIFFLNF
jgi:hypothetical protein